MLKRKEINRSHCNSYEKYKSFYDKQSLKPSLTEIRKSSRMKPTVWAIRQILDLKPPPCRVLDVGCQHGIVELLLATLWYDVTAIDVSENYIKACRQNTKIVNEYIKYKILPVEDVHQLKESYQAILCLSVLEHVIDFDRAFDSMVGVADREALMLFIVPIEKSWLTEEHTRIFTDENIYDYFPKQSKIIKISYSDDPSKLGWYAIKYIKEK